MDCFYIITNTKKDPGYVFTNSLIGYLHLNGKKCIQLPTEADVDMQRKSASINPRNSCLIVIGGDGSVLRAAHQVLGAGIPILGINLGTLGYLAEIEKSNWREMMQLFLDGSYEIETRMMLEGRIVERGGKIVNDSRIYHALNEAVIVRNSAVRVTAASSLRRIRSLAEASEIGLSHLLSERRNSIIAVSSFLSLSLTEWCFSGSLSFFLPQLFIIP